LLLVLALGIMLNLKCPVKETGAREEDIGHSMKSSWPTARMVKVTPQPKGTHTHRKHKTSIAACSLIF
jgi:hypothetical protein